MLNCNLSIKIKERHLKILIEDIEALTGVAPSNDMAWLILHLLPVEEQVHYLVDKEYLMEGDSTPDPKYIRWIEFLMKEGVVAFVRDLVEVEESESDFSENVLVVDLTTPSINIIICTIPELLNPDTFDPDEY